MKKFFISLFAAMLCLGAANVSSAAIIEDIIPENGATIPGFLDIDENPTSPYNKIKVKFAEKPEYFEFALFGDATDPESFLSTWTSNEFTLDSDGYYVKEFMINLLFAEGTTAMGVFTTYTDQSPSRVLLGTENVYWQGSSESTVSDVTVTNIEPALGDKLILNDDGSATVTLTFSAPVTCSASVPVGMGASIPVDTKPENEEETVWSVLVSADMVQDVIETYELFKVTFFAIDGAGKEVNYDGLGFIALEYETDVKVVKGRDFEVEIAGMTVEAPVESFKVADDLGISPNDYNENLLAPEGWTGEEGEVYNPFKAITVSDAEGNVVSGVKSVNLTGEDDPDGEFNPAQFDGTVMLTNPITVPGVYNIYFPYAAFVLGEETYSFYSIEKTVSFTVSESGGACKVTEDSIGKPGVYTLTGIKVLDKADSDSVKNLPAGIYIVNGKLYRKGTR